MSPYCDYTLTSLQSTELQLFQVKEHLVINRLSITIRLVMKDMTSEFGSKLYHSHAQAKINSPLICIYIFVC